MRFLILTTVLLSGIAQGAADKPVVIPKGEAVTGLCVVVHNGDSMTLLIATPEGKPQSKIRMDAIDGPELGQPFSNRSKKTLSDMVFDKQCTVESLGPDKYRRTIGRVSVAGIAWHFASTILGRAWPTDMRLPVGLGKGYGPTPSRLHLGSSAR